MPVIIPLIAYAYTLVGIIWIFRVKIPRFSMELLPNCVVHCASSVVIFHVRNAISEFIIFRNNLSLHNQLLFLKECISLMNNDTNRIECMYYSGNFQLLFLTVYLCHVFSCPPLMDVTLIILETFLQASRSYLSRHIQVSSLHMFVGSTWQSL